MVAFVGTRCPTRTDQQQPYLSYKRLPIPPPQKLKNLLAPFPMGGEAIHALEQLPIAQPRPALRLSRGKGGNHGKLKIYLVVAVHAPLYTHEVFALLFALVVGVHILREARCAARLLLAPLALPLQTVQKFLLGDVNHWFHPFFRNLRFRYSIRLKSHTSEYQRTP